MPETFNRHVNETCALADASVHQILATEQKELGKSDDNTAIPTTSPNA